MVMEAKKSLNLPPASWRTEKDGGIIQFKAEDLRAKEPMA